MKDGLVYFIGGRNSYTKEIVFEDAENWDFCVNHKLHSELTAIDSDETISK